MSHFLEHQTTLMENLMTGKSKSTDGTLLLEGSSEAHTLKSAAEREAYARMIEEEPYRVINTWWKTSRFECGIL